MAVGWIRRRYAVGTDQMSEEIDRVRFRTRSAVFSILSPCYRKLY